MLEALDKRRFCSESVVQQPKGIGVDLPSVAEIALARPRQVCSGPVVICSPNVIGISISPSRYQVLHEVSPRLALARCHVRIRNVASIETPVLT